MNTTQRLYQYGIYLVPALRSILFIAGGLLILRIPGMDGASLNETSKWWALVCIAANFITIGLLFWWVKREGKSFQSLIVPHGKTSTWKKSIAWVVPLMIVLGIGGLFGFSLLIYGYMPVVNTQPIPVWAALIVLLLLPVTIVFSEIPLYMGYCIPRIQKQSKSPALALIYPLFFYALQHSFIPLIFDFQHILSRFLVFIPLLIFMAIWYLKKRDLLTLMIGHGILDFFTGMQLLLVSIDPGIYEMMGKFVK